MSDFADLTADSDFQFPPLNLRKSGLLGQVSNERSAPKLRAAVAGKDDPNVIRPRVHFQAFGPVGVSERGGTGLQPARKAHGQRLHRGVQRTVQAGMPERELVPVPWRMPRRRWNPGEDTTMAKDLTAPGEPVLTGVRRTGRTGVGPQNSHYSWYRKWGYTNTKMLSSCCRRHGILE